MRLLQADAPGALLRSRLRAGQCPRLPFLNDAPHIPAGPQPYHSGSLLDHLTRCMDAVAGDPLAVWLALAHDAGKLTTPAALLPHHYGHELRGPLLAAVWARQLQMPGEWRLAGRMTARLHMRAGRYEELRPATRYDLLREVASCPYPNAFWKVVDADSRKSTGDRARADWERIRTLSLENLPEERARQLAIACLREEAKPSQSTERCFTANI